MSQAPHGARWRLALRLSALVLLASGGLLNGCQQASSEGGENAESAAPRELVVFAAASLRDAFGAVGAEFEHRHPGVTVVFNFAGTQALRAQLELGAAADVLASADPVPMDALQRAGHVTRPSVFAHNELVLVVSREAAARVRSLADLPDAAQVVVGAPEVPVGRYTLLLLEHADSANRPLGPGFGERVLARVVSRELNVRQVLHKVRIGEAEAGVVYRTDTHRAASGVSVVTPPRELNVVANYPVAVTTRAAQPALAAAFVALLLSPDGQRLLAAEGFAPGADANANANADAGAAP